MLSSTFVLIFVCSETYAQPVSGKSSDSNSRNSLDLKGTSASAQNTNERRSAVEKAVASEATFVEKVPLPFPTISSDTVGNLSAVQCDSSLSFPSAIEVRGNAKGLLLHARKETKYDLLSPVSLWLESGPLLVAVRAPTHLSLIATKFGDVCITEGADALLDRGEGTLRIANLSNSRGSVNLVMHDRQWKNSPWAQASKQTSGKSKSKGKKRSEFDMESGSLVLSPGYELIVGDHSLELAEIKPADAIGRRDFRIVGDTGRFAVSEISVDNVAQTHDLVRNLKEHGERANTILSEINRVAAQFKVRQGDEGFEKVTPTARAPEAVRKPDTTKPKSAPKPPLTTATPKKSPQPEKQAQPKNGSTATTGSVPTSNSAPPPAAPKTGSSAPKDLIPGANAVPASRGISTDRSVTSGRASVATEAQTLPETK